jgi:hypothetical protein
MLNLDEHKGLCGLGHQSIIPYIYGRCCISMCMWRCGRLSSTCLILSFVRPFIVQDLGSYIMTQGPTGDPRVVEFIHGRALSARSSK